MFQMISKFMNQRFRVGLQKFKLRNQTRVHVSGDGLAGVFRVQCHLLKKAVGDIHIRGYGDGNAVVLNGSEEGHSVVLLKSAKDPFQ